MMIKDDEMESLELLGRATHLELWCANGESLNVVILDIGDVKKIYEFIGKWMRGEPLEKKEERKVEERKSRGFILL